MNKLLTEVYNMLPTPATEQQFLEWYQECYLLKLPNSNPFIRLRTDEFDEKEYPINQAHDAPTVKYLARRTTLSPAVVVQLISGSSVLQSVPDDVLQSITPNSVKGPLTLEQKIVIRDTKAHGLTLRTCALAYNTHVTNVQQAVENKFSSTKGPSQSPNAERQYGPLTYTEKVHIRDNRQHEVAQQLALHYNTSVNNVRLAQKGQFKEPQRYIAPSRPFGPLTIAEKILIADNHAHTPPSELATLYNTSPMNVIRAQRGQFTRPQAPLSYDSVLDGIPLDYIISYVERQ